MFGNFDNVIEALPNEVLRDQVGAYFQNRLSNYEKLNQEEYAKEVLGTLEKWPVIYDYYIKGKEENGRLAASIAQDKVEFVDQIFVQNVNGLISGHLNNSAYGNELNTYEDAMKRLLYLKDVIENKGGHRFFWMKDTCIDRESDLQILYRLTWIGTLNRVSREVNDGRGPVDFEVSRGTIDATLVEFKLARNGKLKQNIQHQTNIYEGASNPTHPSIKAIFYFTESEYRRVLEILKELKLEGDPNIVLIDARRDNKPSGSNAA